jgi:hypothetical protein
MKDGRIAIMMYQGNCPATPHLAFDIFLGRNLFQDSRRISMIRFADSRGVFTRWREHKGAVVSNERARARAHARGLIKGLDKRRFR